MRKTTGMNQFVNIKLTIFTCTRWVYPSVLAKLEGTYCILTEHSFFLSFSLSFFLPFHLC